MRNSWNRSLEEVAEAVCGRNCVDLLNDTIKILEIHFSSNKKVQMQNNFITTIKNAASFLFVQFTYTYPRGEKYDIQNPSNIKGCLSCLDN